MKGLIWFRQDLRLSDNPALISLTKQCNHAIMLFVIDPEWFKKTAFQSIQLGYYREIFLYQTLRELDAELRKYGQRLVIKVGNPLAIIPALCKKHRIDLVTLTEGVSLAEQRQVGYLKTKLSARVQCCESYRLFFRYQLGLIKPSLSSNFSDFCQHVAQNNLQPCIPISAPDSLPDPINEKNDAWRHEFFLKPLPFYQGGEDAANMRLKEFFWKTAGLQHYHQSLTDLQGMQSSSRFSAWLTNGSLSVRNVAAELDKYEYRYGNDSAVNTLYRRLLHREYYQWMFTLATHSAVAVKKSSVFHLSQPQLQALKDWQQGNTAYPLVNACMKQLNHMGYLSYLGRKIVADYVVNALQLDWRYGAAYFQQQLIDHDVAINYGQWQKLAATEQTDPFAVRVNHYMQSYDPNEAFVTRWMRNSNKVLLR